jgi:UPF0755 protein
MWPFDARVYGLVGGKGVLDQPITRANIDEETPYNTYRINGLPPTPIANPGRASIEATLNPAKTSDLYSALAGQTVKAVSYWYPNIGFASVKRLRLFSTAAVLADLGHRLLS